MSEHRAWMVEASDQPAPRGRRASAPQRGADLRSGGGSAASRTAHVLLALQRRIGNRAVTHELCGDGPIHYDEGFVMLGSPRLGAQFPAAALPHARAAGPLRRAPLPIAQPLVQRNTDDEDGLGVLLGVQQPKPAASTVITNVDGSNDPDGDGESERDVALPPAPGLGPVLPLNVAQYLNTHPIGGTETVQQYVQNMKVKALGTGWSVRRWSEVSEAIYYAAAYRKARFYHATNPANKESIEESGLLASKGGMGGMTDLSQDSWKVEGRIHVAEGKKLPAHTTGAKYWMRPFLGRDRTIRNPFPTPKEYRPDGPLNLDESRKALDSINKRELVKDPNCDSGFTTGANIPSESILFGTNRQLLQASSADGPHTPSAGNARVRTILQTVASHYDSEPPAFGKLRELHAQAIDRGYISD